MKKNLFFRIGLPILFFLTLFACRSEEVINDETKFSAPAVAFERFDNKILVDQAFKIQNKQSIDNPINKHTTNSSKTNTTTIIISEVSYKIPFKETIDAYLQNNQEFSQAFYSQFGQPFYKISTYTYGANSKAIAFPIIKNDQVNAIIYGIVSPYRDDVQFTILQNNDPTTLYITSLLQYEFDHLYPAGPEPMGRSESSISQKGGLSGIEKYIREQNIEEVTIIKMNKWDSGGGSFGFLFPGINWWKDSNWVDSQFAGLGGGSSGQSMSGSGTKHDKFPDYMDSEDEPCNKAKAASTKATENSKTETYTNSKTSIIGMNNGLENGVVFGNENGLITSTAVQTGSANSATLNHSFTNPIADLHNHHDNKPPSVGDVYALIGNQKSYTNYDTRYVITPNGTTYALVVTDSILMNIFLRNYPPDQANPNMSPNFPQPIFNEWDDISFYNNDNKEMALAHILDKYNSGIALTKLDITGNFKKINVTENNISGTKTYSQSNCP